MNRVARLTCTILFLVLAASNSYAAPSLKLTGKILKGGKYSVILLSSDGTVKKVKASNKGAFTFTKLSAKNLKNATLQVIGKTGQYFGPLVLSSSKKKAYLNLSGSVSSGNSAIELGDITLGKGFAKVKKIADAKVVARSKVTKADNQGKPLGADKSGYVGTLSNSVAQNPLVTAKAVTAGGDTDSDGVPDVFDVDDDGDLNIDSSDPQSAATTASSNPFTTLYLSMPDTLNANISSFTLSEVDEVIGGLGKFALIFYFSQEPGSTVTGGHVICDPSPLYCRRAADGGSAALYTGVSGSNPDITNQAWSNYVANGSGYPNLEPITNNGGSALVAGINPNVPTSQLRAGDVYQLVMTNGSRTVSTRTLSLSPYFVSVPAVASFNAGSGVHTADYTNTNDLGMNDSNPIVLDTPGILELNLWRPQRFAIPGAETGDYRDMGHLHYGLIVSGNMQEFTCGGYYSDLSSGLTESSSLGEGSSPFSSQGATLWPLNDAAGDSAPSSSSVINFKVDLKSCIARAGVSPGLYQVNITAAGEQLSGGANRAAQCIWVMIP